MKDKFNEFGNMVWYTIVFVFLGVLVIGLLQGFGLISLPFIKTVEREAVEQSKSYNDSKSIQLVNFIKEYNSLETKAIEAETNKELAVAKAYRSQKDAVFAMICQHISTMDINNINPKTLKFISINGGCE